MIAIFTPVFPDYVFFNTEVKISYGLFKYKFIIC
jgi:hypothetical protein